MLLGFLLVLALGFDGGGGRVRVRVGASVTEMLSSLLLLGLMEGLDGEEGEVGEGEAMVGDEGGG